ncbi:MAG: beta-propeller domain-containing protein, partial [Coriobacteriales bacterium]|nr:beta-propeller domain-containing protein [Coriobacteriales bacterium]
MDNSIFKDMREQMKPSEDLLSRLDAALEAEVPGSEQADVSAAAAAPPSASAAAPPAPTAATKGRASQRRRRATISLSIAAAFILVVVAGSLFLNFFSSGDWKLLLGSFAPRNPQTLVAEGPVRAPADYRELYSILDEMSLRNRGLYGYDSGFGVMADAGTAVDEGMNQTTPTSNEGSGANQGGSGGEKGTSASPSNPPDAAPSPDLTPETTVEPMMPGLATSGEADKGETGEYSETNTQVKGIDEADIVKTDGSYIYALAQGELVIFEAAGADTAELSRLRLSRQDDATLMSIYPQEFYISGDILAVLISYSEYPMDVFPLPNPTSNSNPTSDSSSSSNSNASSATSAGSPGSAGSADGSTGAGSTGAGSPGAGSPGSAAGSAGSPGSIPPIEPSPDILPDIAPVPSYLPPVFETRLAFYDISNRRAPALLTEFAQSGDYRSSRLYDGALYLISSYYLPGDAKLEEPGTFVPMLGEGQARECMLVEDIRIMPAVRQPNYTVVTSYDIRTHERLDQKTVLGEASTVYMGYDNLYLASSLYTMEQSEPFTESVYTIVEYTNKYVTQIVRIGIGDGRLDVGAQCVIDGTLLNQFSLDEYEGNLRLALTVEDHSYRVLRDPSQGVEVYQPSGENISTNAIYVLDSSLAPLGSITGLAATERIYSVRFAGPVGYMVTFRQTDPLFALDLSNPKAPKVTSELKIPGFSTYLHPFASGRLLGLGYDAEDGRSTWMKLSMFDISNPFDVSELSTEIVYTHGSEALYNHRAVLIDAERNIIGFPGRERTNNNLCYFVYGYDDA